MRAPPDGNEQPAESHAVEETEKSLELADRGVLTLYRKSGENKLSPFLRTEQFFETDMDYV